MAVVPGVGEKSGLEIVVLKEPTQSKKNSCEDQAKLFGHYCWCSTNNTLCEHYNPNAAATFKEVNYGGCLKNYRLEYGPNPSTSDEKVN
jgi:hypothetical protein